MVTLLTSKTSAFEAAAEMLARLTGWTVQRKGVSRSKSDWQIDEHWDLHIDGRRQALSVEYKSQMGNAMLARTIEQLRLPRNPPPLLVVPYIQPSVAKTLREAKLSYLDLKGNVYFHLPCMIVWFMGTAKSLVANPVAIPHAKIESLTVSGVKLIYHLLTDPERINESYHQLAKRADISSATIKAIMDWLQKRNYLRIFGSSNRSRRLLTDRKKLLEEWVGAYAVRFRPKLEVGQFNVDPAGTNVEFSFTKEKTKWGVLSEPTGLLKNGRAGGPIIVYGRERSDLNRLIAQKHLKRDIRGEIELLIAFWPSADEVCPGTAPPLIVYADLLKSPNSRNWEFAEQIYETYLKSLIDEY